jgi:hypothetical protein
VTLTVIPGPTGAMARAIRSRLEIAFPPARFSHAYLPSKLTVATWNDLLQRMPFVGVGWVGHTSKDTSRVWKGDASFAVALVTENKHGLNGRLFGDSFAPGLFDMVDAATAILNGTTLCEKTLYVGAAENVFSEGLGDEKAIAMLIVHAGITTRIGDVLVGPELDAPEFLTAEWTWNYLDADGLPDGQLVVNEQETQ